MLKTGVYVIWSHSTSFMVPLLGIRQYSLGSSVFSLCTRFGQINKFYGVVTGDRRNLVINIQTKEENTNLDI